VPPAAGRWANFRAAGSIAFLAEVDGAPVSFGIMDRSSAGPMLLAGGVTRPAYRGRGAYRALVYARRKAAEEAGAPALVTQAQAASRPILERLGFHATGTIEVLVDRP
jgi:GNAT superfamily N-acetyltransferase